MANESQNYPPNMPQQVPPVTPTQAFPSASQPTSYAPQQYAPQSYPQQADVPQQYAPMPAPPMAITPAQAKPVRKKQGGSAALVWLLGGCGVIALIFIISVTYFAMNVGSAVGESTNAMPGAARNLMEINAALSKYTQAHEGHYPPSLEKIVDADVLVYTNKKGEKVHVEYTPPGEYSPPDAGIAGFYLGDVFKYGQMLDQRLYVRLLRNGSIVQEQVQRMPLTR